MLTEKLGLTHLIEYEIQTLDITPVRLASYRLAPPKMKYLRERIKKLLRYGVPNLLRPVTLVPYFVSQTGVEGAYRAVVDYGALNKRNAINSVPLPDIRSVFHWFAKVKYFTTLDLNQAYHLIPLTKSSKPLGAFCTDFNLY